MTKKERIEIESWAAGMSDEKLKEEYYNLAYDVTGSLTDDMYEMGYDMQDIIERQKYEKFMMQKCDLIGLLCEKRGIKLWEHVSTTQPS